MCDRLKESYFNLKMKRFSLLFVTLMFFHLMCQGSASAAQYHSARSAAQGAVDVLDEEIRRDEEIISFKMNVTRLKQTRMTLAAGLQNKRDVINGFARYPAPGLERAITTLSKTLEDEESIANDWKIGPSVVINTGRRLRNNLKKKEAALQMFSEFLGQ